nr:MAG TPA: hypothetical protein [Caudoviricetes sp.]DAX61449.1 MAG TPA: hypothetical protein [Caudoviricetes sp.]DAZ24655.1 MAG TPA: hypothetical protein [Caudoviricetes sp.]
MWREATPHTLLLPTFLETGIWAERRVIENERNIISWEM